MDLGLVGKTVLVAGASRGLGFEIVRQLLDEGASVVAVSRERAAMSSARERWEGETKLPTRLTTLALDLSRPESARQLELHFAKEASLDAAIVVAGAGGPTHEPPTTAFFSAASRNVMPSLVVVEALGTILHATPESSLVLVSSIAGLEHIQCPPEYAAAKASLHAYASHWARQFAPTRVNVIAPGNMLTEGSVWERKLRDDPVSLARTLEETVALKRLGEPEEVARVAVLMISSATSFMTGSTVVVDGGQVRRW